MPGTATNQLTNITLAEAADSGNWDDIGGGQGSAQSDDAPREGTENRGRRVDNAIRGFQFDNGTGIDISASGIRVGFWLNVLQPSKLNADSAEFILSGGATGKGTPWSGHVFPASDYPEDGGWVRVWIDPTRTPEYTGGTLVLTAVRGYGVEVDLGDVGGNSLNVNLDRIDYGTEGIAITGGTSGSPATFAEMITLDANNALGILNSNFLNGIIKIGGANTYFKDTTYNLKAGSQPLSGTGWIKIIFDISSATSELFPQGIGLFNGITLEIIGSSGTLDLGNQTIEGSPDFVLNAQVTFGGKWENGGELAWNGADLRGLTISNSSPILVDESTSFVDLFENMTFISGGTGHGLKLEEGVPTNINLKNITWSGYGLDTTTDAAIWYDGTTPITITYSGGNKPTVRGANITVQDATYTISVPNVPIGTEFTVRRGSERIYHEQNSVASTVTFTTALTGIPVKFVFVNAGNIVTKEVLVDLIAADQTLPITFDTPESYSNT